MNRRNIPVAVGAAIMLPATAQTSAPPQQLAALQAQVLTLRDEVAALKAWRTSVEAVWPQIVGN